MPQHWWPFFNSARVHIHAGGIFVDRQISCSGCKVVYSWPCTTSISAFYVKSLYITTQILPLEKKDFNTTHNYLWYYTLLHGTTRPLLPITTHNITAHYLTLNWSQNKCKYLLLSGYYLSPVYYLSTLVHYYWSVTTSIFILLRDELLLFGVVRAITTYYYNSCPLLHGLKLFLCF